MNVAVGPTTEASPHRATPSGSLAPHPAGLQDAHLSLHICPLAPLVSKSGKSAPRGHVAISGDRSDGHNKGCSWHVVGTECPATGGSRTVTRASLCGAECSPGHFHQPPQRSGDRLLTQGSSHGHCTQEFNLEFGPGLWPVGGTVSPFHSGGARWEDGQGLWCDTET